jgi:ribosomal protection tetracycline resistance protein
MQALERAGTVVCEPVLRVRLELPAATIGAALAALARLGAVAQTPSLQGELATIETVLAAARVQELQRQLPALTVGEGVLESDFGGYEAVSGAPPTRPRTTANPLNREEYLMQLARRATGTAGRPPEARE